MLAKLLAASSGLNSFIPNKTRCISMFENTLTKFGEGPPNLVNVFSNMEMHLVLFGMKEFKPEDAAKSFASMKFEREFYSCIEVDIVFRTVPRSYQGQYGTHYIHSGRTDLNFKCYALTDQEI